MRLRTLLSLALISMATSYASANEPAPQPPNLLEQLDQNIGSIGAFLLYGAIEHENHLKAFEAAASDFRDKKLRLSTGKWKLSALYESLIGDPNDPRWSALIERWRKLYPESPTPYIVMGQLMWVGIVGPNPTPLVDDMQTRDQDAVIKKADALRAFLSDNAAIAGRDPHWIVLMARASMMSGQDATRFTALIIEGLMKEPTYYTLYEVGTDFHLQSGGNSAALDNWARKTSAMAEIKNAKSAYARIYLHAFMNGYGWELFRKSRIEWELFKKSARAMYDMDPSERNRGHAALMACLANDHAETRRLLLLTSEPLDFYPLAGPKEREPCVAWASKPAWRIRIEDYATLIARTAVHILFFHR